MSCYAWPVVFVVEWIGHRARRPAQRLERIFPDDPAHGHYRIQDSLLQMDDVSFLTPGSLFVVTGLVQWVLLSMSEAPE